MGDECVVRPQVLRVPLTVHLVPNTFLSSPLFPRVSVESTHTG